MLVRLSGRWHYEALFNTASQAVFKQYAQQTKETRFCNKSYFYDSKSHVTSYPAFKRATELALPASPEKRLNLMSKTEVSLGNSATFQTLDVYSFPPYFNSTILMRKKTCSQA